LIVVVKHMNSSKRNNLRTRLLIFIIFFYIHKASRLCVVHGIHYHSKVWGQ